MTGEYPKRRFLISDGKNSYKLFTFVQNRNDGSIYVCSPDFKKIKWITPIMHENFCEAPISDSPGDGKLSIHRSGVVKITPDRIPRIFGNSLMDLSKNTISPRHLFSVFLTKPSLISDSNTNIDPCDLIISSKPFSPCVFIFFAVPRLQLQTTVKISFSLLEDDCEQVPPNSGFGAFSLITHSICWIAYSTKHMRKWPQNPHVCYFDGYKVPVIIGENGCKFRLELRNPKFEFNNQELLIDF